MMSERDFANSVAAAKARVTEMDRVDGRKDRELRTILLALEAGLKQPMTGAQFDAYYMLKDISEKE